MSKPTKGFLLTGLAIVIISVGPMIVTLIAAAIAGALGCPLDEGSVHSCVVLGVDLGGALYAMGLFAWFVMFTFPLGALALLTLLLAWIIAALTGRLKRADVPDAAG
jgi:hypothetical protein